MNEKWTWRPLEEVTMRGSVWNPRADPRPLIHYVDVSAVSRDELKIVDDVEHSAANAPSRARKIVKAGDTVFATVRPSLRRIAQIPPSLDGEIASTAFCVLRPNLSVIHPDFLYFAMQLDDVTGGIAAMETGASYPAVRDTDVLNQAIPLPPLSDQHEIAIALNLVRSAVLGQKRCEDAAISVKRAAMQTLFTRGLRGEAQKETEIGPVPESWEIGQLGDFANVISTRMSYSELDNAEQPTTGDAVIVQGIKVSDMNLLGNELELQTAALERMLNKGEAKYRCAPPGTIIFPKRGAAIATNKKRISTQWTAFDPNVIGIASSGNIEQTFLFEWFQMFDLRTITELGPTPQLNKKNLQPLSIPVPPTGEEQRDIVAILNTIDRKIALHRHKHAVLEELFKALLHKLMTGEINIKSLNLDLSSVRRGTLNAGNRPQFLSSYD